MLSNGLCWIAIRCAANSEQSMKKFGAVFVILGFANLVRRGVPDSGYNIVGLPILIVRAILYSLAKRGERDNA